MSEEEGLQDHATASEASLEKQEAFIFVMIVSRCVCGDFGGFSGIHPIVVDGADRDAVGAGVELS